ncbi:hypothetical protein Cfor_08358 [Coptotermes formosanus]|uniref:Reverse transcriptase domain-containing protein n=1 Tax=Coptotermes formosanus TaxID=36987 RepID=A0A6L2Q3L4_COPFO|nr:hypothetical protein Cfor_08358 [Coptotermes formosanus]
MYIRLKTFITYNNILVEAQNGFREGRSAESAILTFLDKIFEALDTKIMTIGIFLDLSKAYDVINHKILLTKLEDYGFRGVVNNWLQSYLTGHKQYVEVKYKGNKDIILDNVKSDLKEIHSGVPQGSILGPVLFLLFINDLTRHILDADVVLFVDDTNILIQAEDENVIQMKINRTMNTLYKWFYTNGLVINTEKSAAMSFHSWQDKNPIKPQIRFNNIDITYTSEIKFLGICLMESLKWEAHIKALWSKLNQSLYMLQSLKYSTSIKLWRSMYFAHFHSYIRYGIIFWGNSGESQKVFKLQKKAIRLMSNVRRNTSCRELFKRWNILNSPLCIYYGNNMLC